MSSQAQELPIVIDVEASGLGPGSYPIEVGFVLADGTTHCTLIKPLGEWTHWSREAETLHGISRQVLENTGRNPEDVALFLNQHLQGKTIYSDAWGQDSCWLGMLFDCVGLWPAFKVDTIRALLREEQVAYWQQARAQVLKELKLRRHRASADARIIQQTYLLSGKLADRQTLLPDKKLVRKA